MPDIKDISSEIGIRRQELQSLKHCQLQYFTIAITSTGLILGFSSMLNVQLKGLALLAPLTIILPSWIIFFDKATSITRIVGYQRVLEEQLNGQNKYRYIGYENALAEFRAKEKETWKKISNSASLGHRNFSLTRHRYWFINYCTFLILSIICLAGSCFFLIKDNPIVTLIAWTFLPFVFVIMCLLYTYWLLRLLTRGRLSYNNCTKIWQHILTKNIYLLNESDPNQRCRQTA